MFRFIATGAHAMAELGLEFVERCVLGLVVSISCARTGGRGVQAWNCPDRGRRGQAS